MEQYNLQMPHSVYAGRQTLSRLPIILEQNRVKKPVVFTDKGVRGAGLLDMVLSQMPDEGKVAVVLDDLPSEPNYSQAQELVDACRTAEADFIIALGGGSVMDTAKLASILMTDKYSVKDLLDSPLLTKKSCKTLMIPTTAGTGAEATPNAIVAVPERELKVGIVNSQMIPDYVILDPEMIKNLPRGIAAATGLDALTHAIECFTSNKANPFSDLFALQALDMILNNIEKACKDPEAIDAKEKMLIASFYGGVAITASGTTAVHALSYPLGGKYHIAHGISNAILLVPVMKFNEPTCRERFAAVYDRCAHEESLDISVEEKSAYIIDWLEKICERLDIPTSLKEFGVTYKDLDTLVDAGMQVTRLLVNNMRKITSEDARRIYQQIL
ncbi:MAG: iron-containing alcohol dehydrogenase [Eubacteriales bacterium]|jgi:alcohol dehydrogenase class IV